MGQIGITLYSNRTHRLDNPDDTIIIAGENQATSINVKFPVEYENYSKRVDLINIRGEKWTEALYMPEDERNNYDSQFNKNDFVYKLPDAITTEGEILMQFIAYKPDTDIFVPFEMVKLTVKMGANFCRKARRNPDLIVKAYEYSNNALSIAKDSLSKVSTIEGKTNSLETSINDFKTEIRDALAEIDTGGGGGSGGNAEFQLPTDKGELNFLAGDGSYKKVTEIADETGNSSVKVGVGTTKDILIKRVNGAVEQTILATGTQLELKVLNTTSNRYTSIQLYATGMIRLRGSTGASMDTLEIMNGVLKFNNKKVLTEE